MKNIKPRWIVIGVIVLALVAGVIRAMSNKRAQQAAASAPASAVTQVELANTDVMKTEMRDITQGLSVSGTVKAVNYAVIKARVAGELKEVVAREGDTVKRTGRIVEVAVVDDDDNFLPAGETGEIVCRGPQTMAYYWNRPEATEQAFRSGWLHTGDVGYMDKDGFYYLVDRKNDMLISGGYNVYPREVEDVLMAFDGVVEAAVVGLPDEKWGDMVHAVVAGRPDLDLEALNQYARDKLANYKRPKGISVWPELPKSAANKILRREVREKYWEGHAGRIGGALFDGLGQLIGEARLGDGDCRGRAAHKSRTGSGRLFLHGANWIDYSFGHLAACALWLEEGPDRSSSG